MRNIEGIIRKEHPLRTYLEAADLLSKKGQSPKWSPGILFFSCTLIGESKRILLYKNKIEMHDMTTNKILVSFQDSRNKTLSFN
jgi:hypothetical protein